MESGEIIAWTRISVLILALGIAAWLDHKERRVPNEFWITWSKPAIFLWTLDLLNQEAEWYIFASAAGVVAYASIALIGRPTFKDIKNGNRLDIAVSVWYLVGIFGIAVGISNHYTDDLVAILNGEGEHQAQLWWSTVAVFIPIALIDFAWRARLIHGGADCKGLMWASILIPSWSSIPVIYPETIDSTIIALPPAIALLVWGGFAFLILPFIMVIKNLKEGNTNFRLIWHAEKMNVNDVMKSHVWLLSSIVEMPSGDKKIVHKTRAPSKTPTVEKLQQSIDQLIENDVEKVWVTRKYPLLVFLWPATLPLLLVGGPMAIILPAIGLV